MNGFSKYIYLFIIAISVSINVADYYIDSFDCHHESDIAYAESTNHIEKSHSETIEQEIVFENTNIDLLLFYRITNLDNSIIPHFTNSYSSAIWQPPKHI